MTNLPQTKTTKAVLAAVGVIAQVLAVILAVGGILPSEALPYATAFIGVAQVFGVYAVRNAPLGEVDPGDDPAL